MISVILWDGLLAAPERLYVFHLSRRPVRFAGTGNFRHSSRRTSSGEKAGMHTATYSAPSGAGVL